MAGEESKRGVVGTITGWLDEKGPVKVLIGAAAGLVLFTLGAKAAWDTKASAADLQKHEEQARQAKASTDSQVADVTNRVDQLGILVTDDHQKMDYVSQVLFRVAIARGLEVGPPPLNHPRSSGAMNSLRNPGPLRALTTTTSGP